MIIFLIHRWDVTPHADWYPWLKKQLEKRGHEVIIPKMPNTSKPTIDTWVKHLQTVVGKSDHQNNQQTYFIGHSIGCQTIMRYLASLPRQVKVGGVIFVAGWFTLRNLESKEAKAIAKPWLETPLDFAKVREKTKKMVAFFSDNDPYVNLGENKTLFKKNLNATIVVELGKGHFTAEDKVTEMPEVVKRLEKMMS